MTHTCTKVTVRQRAIRNNRISLYLDYYPAVRNPETMQMSRREYLGIYIYAHPKNEMEREFNNDMLNKAEAIRCIRVQSLINEEFGFLDKTKQKADFLAYFKRCAEAKTRNGRLSISISITSSKGSVPLARSLWTCARSSVNTC